MFKKIKALFTKFGKGRKDGQDILQQAVLASRLMDSIHRAMRTGATVLFEIHLPGGRHVFTVQGDHEALPWLYDLAAGSWHGYLSESRELMKKEGLLPAVAPKKRRSPEDGPGDGCNYDNAE